MPELSATAAAIVASCYGLGEPARAPTYAGRGELGWVWRLDTARGSWAIKESARLAAEAETDAAADVAFQHAAAAAGIRLPLPILTRDGQVLLPGPETGTLAGSLRVYEWVDLVPDPSVTGHEVGGITAQLHRIGHPPGRPVEPWYTEPIGAQAWHGLLATGQHARAAWADPLSHLLPGLVELDHLVAGFAPAHVLTCHRDLNVENLRRARDGGVVVLDWENCGPAQLEHELAMVLADLVSDVHIEEAAAAYRGYRAAGGPARLTGPNDFAAAIAVQGHLFQFYAHRALDGSETDDTRRRANRRLRHMLGRPLTHKGIADLLSIR